ncbi:MAG: phosphoribosylformylglycinamidine synthase I [Parcubacteria group bacterium]|nr:phosphoribosylformylglycinamidine synthase I [Parcubacteria group bacterium]
MKKGAHVLWAPGTNCHPETIYALEKVGIEARLFNVISEKKGLGNADLIVIPGGFSFGDYLGAGTIAGVLLRQKFGDDLKRVLQNRTPLLGICNGFQILVRLRIIPSGGEAALLQNASGKFESRRLTHVLVRESPCLWTKGLEGMVLRLPVGHGEGRYVAKVPESTISPLRYVKDNLPTEEYPFNPSGSPGGIAGVCDKTGRILGLMPHPERAVEEWHDSQDGLLLLRNIIKYL